MSTPETSEAVAVLKAEYLDAASTFLGLQLEYGNQVKLKSIQFLGQLLDAHLLATGVLGTALLRANFKYTEITPTSTRRNALFASFVIGLPVCMEMILEGRYLQAGALLRQEVETLAALNEVAAGNRQDGKTPNLKSLEPSISRLYGDLSAAAHVSNHDLVNAITEWIGKPADAPGPVHVTRHFPALIEDLARKMYGLHVYLILKLLEQLSSDFHNQRIDEFTAREREAINAAVDLMMQAKVLEPSQADG